MSPDLSMRPRPQSPLWSLWVWAGVTCCGAPSPLRPQPEQRQGWPDWGAPRDGALRAGRGRGPRASWRGASGWDASPHLLLCLPGLYSLCPLGAFGAGAGQAPGGVAVGWGVLPLVSLKPCSQEGAGGQGDSAGGSKIGPGESRMSRGGGFQGPAVHLQVPARLPRAGKRSHPATRPCAIPPTPGRTAVLSRPCLLPAAK